MKVNKYVAALLSAAMVITSAAVTVLAEEDPVQSMPTTKWEDQVLNAEETKDYEIDQENKTVKINSELGLAWFAKQVNDKTKDTDGDGDTAKNRFAGYTVTLTKSLDLHENLWTPIGYYTGLSNYGTFNGTFVADKDVIVKGLRIVNDPSYSKIGLFSYTSGATLRDIKIEDAIVNIAKGSSASGFGVLVGDASGNTTIENCDINKAVVSGASTVGGLVGTGNGTIKNCKLSDISLTSNIGSVGGIAGLSTFAFNQCSVTGSTIELTGYSGKEAGGIVGRANPIKTGIATFDDVTVKDCTIIVKGIDGGEDTSGDFAGGIVGYLTNTGSDSDPLVESTINGCHVDGLKFQSATKVINGAGGIIGGFANGNITIQNSDVQNVTIGEKGVTQKLLYCGGIIGRGTKWMAVKPNKYRYHVSVENTSVSKTEFECEQAVSIGSLYGTVFKGDEDHDSRYAMTGVKVNSNVEINEHSDDAVLYILGTNYPQTGKIEDDITFDNTKTTVTFEGSENTIPTDVTPFASENEDFEQNEDGTITVKTYDASLLIRRDESVAEGNVFDIIVKSLGDSDIADFKSAQFTVANDTSDSVGYIVEAADETADAKFNIVKSDSGVYAIYASYGNGEEKIISVPADGLKIGKITISGYGSGTLSIGSDSQIHGQIIKDSIVTDIPAKGNSAPYTIERPTASLKVTVYFNNNLTRPQSQFAGYNDMTIAVENELYSEEKSISLTGTSARNIAEKSATFVVPAGYRYTVTLKGSGYRTYSYDVVVDKDGKELKFWNNAMDSDTLIDESNPESVARTTFLAGDIDNNQTINLYDLSAAVAYFGQTGIEEYQPIDYGGGDFDPGEPEKLQTYRTYDLNRDGQIDSKDIAMVLVSWGK